MMSQNVLVALIGLAASVQASPCKPSSMTTVTGTASTDTSLATTSTDIPSTTGTVTSGELATTTTEAALATTTTTGPKLTYNCPGGFPSHASCGIRYNHNRSNGYIVGAVVQGPWPPTHSIYACKPALSMPIVISLPFGPVSFVSFGLETMSTTAAVTWGRRAGMS
ncbi:hypothetical protein NXS19_010834 [Fusarium pseudograminearum]|nr:hypothetical protein NXS19_010834 [Fusarium pseudograminearum]